MRTPGKSLNGVQGSWVGGWNPTPPALEYQPTTPALSLSFGRQLFPQPQNSLLGFLEAAGVFDCCR